MSGRGTFIPGVMEGFNILYFGHAIISILADGLHSKKGGVMGKGNKQGSLGAPNRNRNITTYVGSQQLSLESVDAKEVQQIASRLEACNESGQKRIIKASDICIN